MSETKSDKVEDILDTVITKSREVYYTREQMISYARKALAEEVEGLRHKPNLETDVIYNCAIDEAADLLRGKAE